MSKRSSLDENTRLSERQNLLVVAVSIGIGMVPLVSPTMLAQFPSWTALAAFTAVVLNALFNGGADAIPEEAPRAVVPTVSGEIPEPSRV
jgi:xanthine/uracil permease